MRQIDHETRTGEVMSIKHAVIDATGALATSKSYLLAGSLGATVELWTGYPGMVWIAMFIGAFVIRKTPDGAFSAAGVRRTLWKGLGAVAIAWAGTGAIIAEINRPELVYEVLVAAVLAGTSEWILGLLRNPGSALDLLNKFRGNS